MGTSIWTLSETTFFIYVNVVFIALEKSPDSNKIIDIMNIKKKMLIVFKEKEKENIS